MWIGIGLVSSPNVALALSCAKKLKTTHQTEASSANFFQSSRQISSALRVISLRSLAGFLLLDRGHLQRIWFLHLSLIASITFRPLSINMLAAASRAAAPLALSRSAAAACGLAATALRSHAVQQVSFLLETGLIVFSSLVLMAPSRIGCGSRTYKLQNSACDYCPHTLQILAPYISPTNSHSLLFALVFAYLPFAQTPFPPISVSSRPRLGFEM